MKLKGLFGSKYNRIIQFGDCNQFREWAQINRIEDKLFTEKLGVLIHAEDEFSKFNRLENEFLEQPKIPQILLAEYLKRKENLAPHLINLLANMHGKKIIILKLSKDGMFETVYEPAGSAENVIKLLQTKYEKA